MLRWERKRTTVNVYIHKEFQTTLNVYIHREFQTMESYVHTLSIHGSVNNVVLRVGSSGKRTSTVINDKIELNICTRRLTAIVKVTECEFGYLYKKR